MNTPVSASDAPLVGIVVVTFNSRKYFSRLDAALRAQTDRRFRTIIVDNGSLAAERPMSDDFPDASEIIQLETNEGFASSNNMAVGRLDTPLVALLNPDAFPDPSWLACLIAASERYPEAAAFGSVQVMADDPARYDGLGDCLHAFGLPWRGGYGLSRPHESFSTRPTFSACAAAALYRRTAWLAVGGFANTFFCYCEDVDLGFRLRLAGHQVVQLADATVSHVGGASSGPRSAFAVFHGTRNRIWTFVRCMPPLLFWLCLPGHVLAHIAFLVVSPFRGTGTATWKGVWAAVNGLSGVWRERRYIQMTRKVSTLQIAAALDWDPLRMLRRAPPKPASVD